MGMEMARAAVGVARLLHSASSIRKCDASRSRAASYGRMDVLIVERDDLVAEVLADALADEGLTISVVPTEQAANRIAQDDLPRVVITGMNRNSEDMAWNGDGEEAVLPLAVPRNHLPGGTVAGSLAAGGAERQRTVSAETGFHVANDSYRARVAGIS